MKRLASGLAALALYASTSVAAAGVKLVITEIHYDPTSAESKDKQTEWVELFNAGDQDVALKGLQLTSGMHTNPETVKQKHVIAGDGVVKPGGYVVIGVGAAGCYEGLGLPPMAACCGEEKMPWLANNGDSVAVRDEKGQVIDQVIYEVNAPWPERGHGQSIQFLPPAGEADLAKANDDPKHWVLSDDSNAQAFPEHGTGTPGAAPNGAASASPEAVASAASSAAAAPTTKPSAADRTAAKKK